MRRVSTCLFYALLLSEAGHVTATTSVGSLSDLQSVLNLTSTPSSLLGEWFSELAELSQLTSLRLSGEGLQGTIPTEIGLLGNLSALDLSGNSLSGYVPSEIGSLSRLTLLDLSENELRGSIPEELGLIQGLETLVFRENQLSGPVPGTFSYHNSLRVFDADQNDLSGTLDDTFQQSSKLFWISLRSNNFYGPFPSSWNALTTLFLIDLSNNRLGDDSFLLDMSRSSSSQCSLPESWRTLSNLRVLILRGNVCSGSTIPSTWSQLENLELLSLESMNLAGTLPEQLGAMSRLKSLSISSNPNLSGLIPKEWEALGDSLEVLQLFGNNLTGPVIEFGHFKKLKVVELQSNRLTGTLPLSIGELSILDRLDLSSNSFTGPLPASLVDLPLLHTLNLAQNQFNGSLPWNLTDSANHVLEYLGLRENFFSGSIEFLQNLHAVKFVDLGANELEGELMATNASWTMLGESLEHLDLSRNRKLGGTLPAGISDLKKLTSLDLSENAFQGLIPDLAPLNSTLKLLRLNDNQFNGFETTLETFDRFDKLDLSRNPWTCECDLVQWLPAYLRRSVLDFEIPFAVNLRETLCGTANDLDGTELTALLFTQNTPCKSPRSVSILLDHDPVLRLSDGVSFSGNISWPNSFLDTEHNAEWLQELVTAAIESSSEQTSGHAPGCWDCSSLPLVTEVRYVWITGTNSWEPWYNTSGSLGSGAFTNEMVLQAQSTSVLGFQVEILDMKTGLSSKQCCTALGAKAQDGGFSIALKSFPPFRQLSIVTRSMYISFSTQYPFTSSLALGPGSPPILVRTPEWTPKDPPSRVWLVSSSDISARIGWDDPLDPNGVIIGYQGTLLKGAANEGGASELVGTFTSNEPYLVFEGLEPETRYSISLRASTSLGLGPPTAPWWFSTKKGCPVGSSRSISTNNTLFCIPCPPNTYMVQPNTPCVDCPNSFPYTLGEGAVGRDACVTGAGFFELPAEYLDAASFPSIQTTDGKRYRAAVPCNVKVGLSCDGVGLNLSTVTVKAGFWRVSSRALEVLECRDPAFCKGSGESIGGDYCAANRSGFLCDKCVPPLVRGSTGECLECTDSSRLTHTLKLFLVGPCVTFVSVGWFFWTVRVQNLSGSKESRLNILGERYSSRVRPLQLVSAKLRLLITFFQIIATYSREFDSEVLKGWSFGVFSIFFDFDIGSSMNALGVRCAWDFTFLGRLFMTVAFPTVWFVLVLIGPELLRPLGIGTSQVPGSSFQRLTQRANERLVLSIQGLLLLYPVVSGQIFNAFICEDFTEVDGAVKASVLRTDYGLDCEGEKYDSLFFFAVCCVIIYPVGVFSVVLLLLRKIRYLQRLQDQARISPAQARILSLLGYLHGPYKKHVFWFEAYEVLRKLFQVSCLAFIVKAMPKGPGPVFLALFSCGVFLGILLHLRPYKERTDFLFASLSLVNVFGITFFIALGDFVFPSHSQAFGKAVTSIIVLECLEFLYFSFVVIRTNIVHRTAVVAGALTETIRRRSSLHVIAPLEQGELRQRDPLPKERRASIVT